MLHTGRREAVGWVPAPTPALSQHPSHQLSVHGPPLALAVEAARTILSLRCSILHGQRKSAFSLPHGPWCWEHGGSTPFLDRAGTGTVNGHAAWVMAKGPHAAVAHHGQPDFAAIRAGHRPPGGTLRTTSHTHPSPRIMVAEMPLQSMGSWTSSNHLDSDGCCCHGSPHSQVGPLMAVLPDGHPPSRPSSTLGCITALLQSQLLRMITRSSPQTLLTQSLEGKHLNKLLALLMKFLDMVHAKIFFSLSEYFPLDLRDVTTAVCKQFASKVSRRVSRGITYQLYPLEHLKNVAATLALPLQISEVSRKGQ